MAMMMNKCRQGITRRSLLGGAIALLAYPLLPPKVLLPPVKQIARPYEILSRPRIRYIGYVTFFKDGTHEIGPEPYSCFITEKKLYHAVGTLSCDFNGLPDGPEVGDIRYLSPGDIHSGIWRHKKGALLA